MGTATFTENRGATPRSTWTITATGSNITCVNASTKASRKITFAPPSSVKAKKTNTNANKKYGIAYIRGIVVCNGVDVYGERGVSTVGYSKGDDISNMPVITPDTTYSLSKFDVATKPNVYTEDLFTASNNTVKTLPIYFRIGDAWLVSDTAKSESSNNSDLTSNTLNTNVQFATLTLNAPPSATVSDVSFDTAEIYPNYTTASVDISDLTAYFGGTITSAVFKIGTQTDTRTTNGTLYIALDTSGTFTPAVTVTDSRGQVQTYTLPSITVNDYVAPTVNFTCLRSDSTGTPNDEGESAIVTASFDWTSAIASLTAPTVTATDLDGNAVSVTTTWYKDSALTTAISDWSTLTSADMPIYGFIDNSGHNAFNTRYSYQIAITPNDTRDSGTTITQTLGSAFYTIDFLAGGHGIAFGQPSSEEGFVCNMESTFNEESEYVLDVDASASESVDATSGEDKDLFNGIRHGGLFNIVLDNMKLKLKGFLSRLYNGTLGLNEIIPDNSDLDDYKTFGRYGVANATSAGTMTNAPTTASGFVLEVTKGQNDSTITQTAYPYTGTSLFVRGYNINNGNWSSWERPNNSEYIVETVSVGSGTISAGTSENLTVNVAKTGYTPIGIVGVTKTGQSYGTVSISRFNIDGTTAYVSIYNNYSSARTYTVSADILYQRE